MCALRIWGYSIAVDPLDLGREYASIHELREPYSLCDTGATLPCGPTLVQAENFCKVFLNRSSLTPESVSVHWEPFVVCARTSQISKSAAKELVCSQYRLPGQSKWVSLIPTISAQDDSSCGSLSKGHAAV